MPNYQLTAIKLKVKMRKNDDFGAVVVILIRQLIETCADVCIFISSNAVNGRNITAKCFLCLPDELKEFVSSS